MTMDTSFEAMRLALMSEGGPEAFQRYLFEMAKVARKEGKWGPSHSKNARGAVSGHWATPYSVIQESAQILSALRFPTEFTLDVAADPATAVADTWYGPFHEEPERRDSLPDHAVWRAPDNGSVWLNPPYADVELFAKKSAKYDGWQGGATCSPLLFLAFARTDTKWFFNYVVPKSPYCYIRKGRIKFEDPLTSKPAVGGAPAPSFLGIFGIPEEVIRERVQKHPECRQVGRWQLVHFPH